MSGLDDTSVDDGDDDGVVGYAVGEGGRLSFGFKNIKKRRRERTKRQRADFRWFRRKFVG